MAANERLKCAIIEVTKPADGPGQAHLPWDRQEAYYPSTQPKLWMPAVVLSFCRSMALVAVSILLAQV